MSEAVASQRDITQEIQQAVREAAAMGTALKISGGDTKSFYGRATAGEALDIRAHRGIVSYEPTELVLTARAGTPLAEIETALAERGQMLPFEPPYFGEAATVGGDRKSTRLNSSHPSRSRMPSSA